MPGANKVWLPCLSNMLTMCFLFENNFREQSQTEKSGKIVFNFGVLTNISTWDCRAVTFQTSPIYYANIYEYGVTVVGLMTS